MTLEITTWAWIGVVGLALGTIPSLWYLVFDPDNRRYYGVLAAITGIAAVAYVAMALGIGSVDAPGDAVWYAPRYVDWLLTTPLLLLYLAMLAKPGRRPLVALVALDVVVIVAGAAAVLTAGPLSWGLFAIAGVAYLGIVYLLIETLPTAATFASERVAIVFTKLRNLTVVLWTIYPVVWLLAPQGLGWLTFGTEMMVVVYLDFLTKVAFAIVALNGRDALADLGTAEIETADRGVDPTAIGAD